VAPFAYPYPYTLSGLAIPMAYPPYAYPRPAVYQSPVTYKAPVYQQQVAAPAPLVVRVVQYPHGRYELRGDGVTHHRTSGYGSSPRPASLRSRGTRFRRNSAMFIERGEVWRCCGAMVIALFVVLRRRPPLSPAPLPTCGRALYSAHQRRISFAMLSGRGVSGRAWFEHRMLVSHR